jgi:hypothetical protein
MQCERPVGAVEIMDVEQGRDNFGNGFKLLDKLIRICLPVIKLLTLFDCPDK